MVTYSQHYCIKKCHKYFNADLSDLAPPGGQYTHRVMDLAVRLVVDRLPYRPASWHLWRDHRVFVPFATIQNWVEAGNGGRRHWTATFLTGLWPIFQGYVAADELYDGPFCILSRRR